MKTASLIAGLSLVLLTTVQGTPAQAGEQAYLDGSATIVRDTIPHPRAIERQPLTYERLSTTSTRLVDARRGFRPFSSVHGAGGGCALHGGSAPYVIGYHDDFGISRPSNRPFSYRFLPSPRTGVSVHNSAGERATVFNNHGVTRHHRTGMHAGQAMGQPAARPHDVVIDDQRDTQPMKVRISDKKPKLPETSGAVLITADGTVYQIGD